MGQEILYCCHCQRQLRSRDFDAGAALRLDSRVCCQACAPELMKTLPAAAVQEILKAAGSARAPAPESNRPLPFLSSASTLNSTVASRNPGSGISVGALAGIGVGVVALVLLVLAASGSQRSRESRSPAQPREVSIPPPPPRDGGPPVDAAPALPPPGADPLRAARDYARSNPADFAGQAELYERAVDGLRGSPAQAEAKRELDAVRTSARERIASELGLLDPKTREFCGREEFDAALEALEGARRRMNAADWTSAINQRADTVRRQAAELFTSVKQDALAAQRKGAAEKVQSAKDRVAKWGLQPLSLELGKALAEAAAPAAESKAPALSPEAAAYAKSWETALRLAAARDYTAITAELKRIGDAARDESLRKSAAEDQELLRQASQTFKELMQVFLKGAKGQTLSLEFLNPAGAVERAEGSIVRVDPYRIELKRSAGEPLVLPLGELRVSGPANFYRVTRSTATPAELRSLALLCLLDGDPKAALTFAEESALPERFRTFAQAAGSSDAREQEARAAFYSGERTYEDPASTAESAQKEAALLKGYEDTAFVRRNRDFLQFRSQGGKDYFFFPEDMTASGSFVLVKNSKTDTCWSSEADSDPAKTKDNFVEITFSALAGAEYRCWVYAGGCCAETFAFSVQSTDLVAPASNAACEPGSAVFLPVKLSNLSLKKTHAAHNGPKSPARWDWISIPLPKTGAGGLKKIRLLTNQQGFSIAYAAISAVRQASPREGEAKSLEKVRLETPGARPLSRGTVAAGKKAPAANDQIVLYALTIEGGQKPAGAEQSTVEKAPDRPAGQYCLAAILDPGGVSRIYLGPQEGFFTVEGDEVLSFDYWVDSAVTSMNFNVYNRTRQKQHDGIVDKLVTGKWTHFSIRVADLGGAAESLQKGDLVAGFYIQALGGSTRKFFLDNLQITKPRPRK
jgi:hypothetical protein